MNKHLLFAALAAVTLVSCSDDETTTTAGEDSQYYGKAVGNFTEAEWYPGGLLGTTDNTSASSYQDETPAVTNQGLTQSFQNGETFFERNFNLSTPPFNGLGPAWVRKSCIDCHPGYGHGKRQTTYDGNQYGNGYLLVIYNKDTNAYVGEVTGMPQTKAAEPFLPPIDESGIHLSWVNAPEGALPFKFKDGETYSLIYPNITIDQTAFNTSPKPTNYEVRLESTIGIYGTGLLDAIDQDDMKAQYQKEASFGAKLNPGMWDSEKNDWAGDPSLGKANGAWYRLADGTMKVKKFTYAMTRASLQDGPGANAIWNITNVTRSDRHYLYTTKAWAKAMSETPSVIEGIQKMGASANSWLHPFYGDGSADSIKSLVNTLLGINSAAESKIYEKNFVDVMGEEMSDKNYYDFMVWHRGLAVPRARNLNDPQVQRGKKLFYEIGCTNCHRPSWKTGEDNYWVDNSIKAYAKSVGKDPNSLLPKYANQTIWPYTDMVQHRLFMLNDIRTGWCRTTPLWGRGLSKINTGAEDRLHDARARNTLEAIMWHGYSRQSDAFKQAERFYNLSKTDRDAIVAFVNAI